jgi:hypothetical protein
MFCPAFTLQAWRWGNLFRKIDSQGVMFYTNCFRLNNQKLREEAVFPIFYHRSDFRG